MLQHTFCHIPGIGHATENRLWSQGISSWEQLMGAPDIIPRVSGHEISAILQQSLLSLDNDPNFFSARLKNGDAWRLFPHFRKQTAYLDIETTGIDQEAEITTIALYDGNEVKVYVNGRNMDSFLDDVARFTVLITYNGISFDIPFMERFFRSQLKQTQIDLRYVLAQLGCSGGLKGCEKQMGVNRGILDGIDGSFAVMLWREYERYNNEAALETLLAYNIEDTVNLERLMVEAYNRNVEKTPFSMKLLQPYPEAPVLRYQPDPGIMALLKQYRSSY